MLTTSNQAFDGVLISISGLPDVLQLSKEEDLSQVVCLTPSGDVSALAPLLPRIKGVICTGGGPNSHLAIMARAFGIHCLMKAQIEQGRGLHGKRILVNENGEVWLHTEECSDSRN